MTKTTGQMIDAGGIPLMTPNTITAKTQGFYISYNNRDTAIYGSDTTALVQENPTKFLILNGDHTQQYNEIIRNGGAWRECLTYFEARPEQRSKFSDSPEMVLKYIDGKLTAIPDPDYTPTR